MRGGGGGGGSLKLGEYRLTDEWISVSRGLSDRELPAPLSRAGLTRGRPNSRSMLGLRISFVKDLLFVSLCCFMRKSRAPSKRPLEYCKARSEDS